MERMNSISVILDKLPEHVRHVLSQSPVCAGDNSVTEIVLRADRPVCVYRGSRCYYLIINGTLTDHVKTPDKVLCTAKDIENTVLRLCDYSVYAYQNEINGGFITVENGVRVGLCGKAVLNNGVVTNIRDISTLSFRIAREKIGCADPLLHKLDPLRGVLICGEPGSGKTTLIRDLARRMSYRYRVSLLDERGELSAFHRGRSAFDLGLCDIYAGYPKGTAAVSAVRSMAPDIIVCDEMGERSDADMLLYTLRCGVSFVATVHAASMNDLRERKVTADMINTGAFRYIVFLSGRDLPGKPAKIYEMSDSLS